MNLLLASLLHDEIQKRQLVTRLLHWELHNKEKDWP